MSLKDIYNYASEAWDYHNGESYNLDSWSEFNNEKSFEQGVESASEHPVIYIDPDLLPVKEIKAALYNNLDYLKALGIAAENNDKLRDQIEAQKPGAMDALLKRFDGYGEPLLEEATTADIILGFAGKSPAAISDIMIDGEKHCIVYKPSDGWDSKEDIISAMLDRDEIAKSVAENSSVDGESLNYAIGRHEGIHCNKENDPTGTVEVLEEETRADRLGVLTGVDSDTATLMKDMRHLGANGFGAGHSTGILLMSGDEATTAHVGAAGIYKTMMDTAALNDFAETEDLQANQLLRDDPDAYFAGVHEEIGGYKQQMAEFYEAGPKDFFAKGVIIKGEAVIDYMLNYEAAYRRQVLQEDVPEVEPTRILSEEDRKSYAREYKAYHEAPLEIEDEHTADPSDHPQPEPPIDYDPEIPPLSFSGDDATYAGDAGLLQDVAAAGLHVNPDLMTEPLSADERYSKPDSPQQQQTLSM